jgi:hypothetical protein
MNSFVNFQAYILSLFNVVHAHPLQLFLGAGMKLASSLPMLVSAFYFIIFLTWWLGADTIAVVLLDEIGLAQCSNDMPLKVLHSLLAENPSAVAFVGLSNWVLDGMYLQKK